jgi:hypothetical protein
VGAVPKRGSTRHNPDHEKITKQVVQTLPIRIPSISTQKQTVSQLKALATEIQRLESIYQCKLGVLVELKNSSLIKPSSAGYDAVLT